MIKVLFDRLLDMAGIDTKEIWHWPDSEPFSLKEVLEERNKGLVGAKEAYGDTWKYPVKMPRDRIYHIARIIYFIDNPQEITGIEIDNPCSYNSILPGCVIIDGWHRVAAGILLNLKFIEVEYGGRSDVEDYICGKSDERPEHLLIL